MDKRAAIPQPVYNNHKDNKVALGTNAPPVYAAKNNLETIGK